MDKNAFGKRKSIGFNVIDRILRFKVAVIALLSVAVFVCWPGHIPILKGRGRYDDAMPQSNAIIIVPAATTRPDTTQPASTQPVIQQYAANLPLYAPNQEGSDPNWSLPAELTGTDLRKLAEQVNTLSKDIPAVAQEEHQCNDAVGRLFDFSVVNLLWTRLMGKGFRDPNLPLDWYQVVKERNSIVGSITNVTETFTNQAVQMAILMRLASVEVRVIGGNVLIGDMLFVRASQQYIDRRRSYYEQLQPLVRSVTQRMEREFPGALDNSQ